MVRDGVACLDMLAAQMHARGWTAYLRAPADRLASLVVQDPRDDRTMGSDIVAAPAAGDWWYWFSWGERIAPVHPPGAAADAVISALQASQTVS